jgi:hypothetical protein
VFVARVVEDITDVVAVVGGGIYSDGSVVVHHITVLVAVVVEEITEVVAVVV